MFSVEQAIVANLSLTSSVICSRPNQGKAQSKIAPPFTVTRINVLHPRLSFVRFEVLRFLRTCFRVQFQSLELRSDFFTGKSTTMIGNQVFQRHGVSMGPGGLDGKRTGNNSRQTFHGTQDDKLRYSQLTLLSYKRNAASHTLTREATVMVPKASRDAPFPRWD